MQPPYDPDQPAYYPPQLQPPPPPPPRQGMSTMAIVLIVVGVVGTLVLIPLVYGFVIGFRRAMSRAAAAASASAASPGTAVLSETYATQNGLLTAHYPSDFAAKSLDDATIIVSRNFGGGEDEVVTLAAVQDPITDDAREFARLLLVAVDKNVAAKGGTSTQVSQRAGTCLGKYPGVETEGTFKLPTSAVYESKACFFVSGSRGYELRYDVPRSRVDREVPLLERVIDATVLKGQPEKPEKPERADKRDKR